MEEYKLFENVADIDIRLADKSDSEAMSRMFRCINNDVAWANFYNPSIKQL